MSEKLLDKIAELLWSRIEGRIIAACEEGFKRGEMFGYVSGHEDGSISGQEDLIRRVTYLYDEVHNQATKDAYAEAGAIDLEELDEELSLDVFDESEVTA